MHMRYLYGSLLVLTSIIGGTIWIRHRPHRANIFDHTVSAPGKLARKVPYLAPWCDELKGLKSGFIPIKNGKLFYEEEGKGIPLVLIAGGPGNTHHTFHPYFSRAKEYARIIYYDQRGTGKSSIDNTGKTYTVKQAVEDLDCLRKELHINRWIIVGFSYGGFLAQSYAIAHQEHCAGLVLIATMNELHRIKPGRANQFITTTELNAIVDGINSSHSPRLSMYNSNVAGGWKYYWYYKPSQNTMIRHARYNWGPAPGFEKCIRKNMLRSNPSVKIGQSKIPLLIFEGAWDLIASDEHKITALCRIYPRANIKVIKKAGHYIFADQPDKFFGILRNFVRSLPK